jgi:competence CoiA-like predicted nuclease
MKEARHIATGKIVHADDADYKGFYGIYECPSCKAELFLKKEYNRSGKPISSAFIHFPHGTEE